MKNRKNKIKRKMKTDKQIKKSQARAYRKLIKAGYGKL